MSEREQLLSRLEDACGSLLTKNQAPQVAKARIAAWGLVKAGKSSLLNMLSGHIEDEYFKTGSVRTTRLNSELETDRYILVDTPGLGIDEDDTRQAFEGLDGADVILFVHAPQGELDQEEIDLLSKIKDAFGEETERRLILVLTQLDKDQDGALDCIRHSVLQQLQDFIGVQPLCYQVSNTRYRKGACESKAALMQKSGIPALAEHLEMLSLEITNTLDAVRSSRQQAQKTELLEVLDQAIEDARALISVLQQPYAQKVCSFNQTMDELKLSFASHSADIASASKKLNNI
jgi:tRNA U34 5-carboxymethylaminomethyl modifying GTPase MnmE/TrmE